MSESQRALYANYAKFYGIKLFTREETMEVTAWGRYPVIESQIYTPATEAAVTQLLGGADNPFRGIARGLGRSYGDSSLAGSQISTRQLDHFLAFDGDTGLLRCAAGVSLAEILKYFVPRGWFLPITPGTKFITVGGAIASDVHGKNHHCKGSFGDHVCSMRLALPSGEVATCSPEKNPELFRATCGGMGLTGVILDAIFCLKPISSALIDQTTIKAENLAEVIGLFEEYDKTTYSVAWIDCLASGNKLGRSLLTVGEHAQQGELSAGKPAALAIPVDMPSMLLNRFSIQAFNTLYFNRVRAKKSTTTLHYEPFFYPLDGIHQWNRMYGKNGFTQYQFVLPKSAGLEGMKTVLERISASKRGSFLAVLKAFGKGNDNYLSFPMEGYTLALDFKLDKGLFALLDELDKIVLDYGGRIYLSKDVRLSEQTFKQSYPQWQAFEQVRKHYGASEVFNSLQSQRLGI
jgi:FAD/FMN-containing dehydrogenase